MPERCARYVVFRTRARTRSYSYATRTMYPACASSPLGEHIRTQRRHSSQDARAHKDGLAANQNLRFNTLFCEGGRGIKTAFMYMVSGRAGICARRMAQRIHVCAMRAHTSNARAKQTLKPRLHFSLRFRSARKRGKSPISSVAAVFFHCRSPLLLIATQLQHRSPAVFVEPSHSDAQASQEALPVLRGAGHGLRKPVPQESPGILDAVQIRRMFWVLDDHLDAALAESSERLGAPQASFVILD